MCVLHYYIPLNKRGSTLFAKLVSDITDAQFDPVQKYTEYNDGFTHTSPNTGALGATAETVIWEVPLDSYIPFKENDVEEFDDRTYTVSYGWRGNLNVSNELLKYSFLIF